MSVVLAQLELIADPYLAAFWIADTYGHIKKSMSKMQKRDWRKRPS